MVDEKTLAKINILFDDLKDPFTQILHREWYRNILYYMDEQYLEWIGSLNTFRRKRNISRQVPTPISNNIKDFVRAAKALILNKNYKTRVWPNSNELEDKEAALLGEQLLIHMNIANDEEFEDEKEKTALWTILTGTGFMRTFFAKEGGEWGLNASGEIIKDGDIITENILPFNIRVDMLGDSLKAKRLIGIKSLKQKEWVEDTFKTKVNAGTDENIIDYQKRLMSFVANVNPFKGVGLNFGASLDSIATEDLVLFKEIEFRPTNKFKNGRYIVMVGTEVLLALDHLPIPTKKGKFQYTLTDFHYNYVPGRFWSDSGVNSLISPQNSINSIDQALEMNRKGLGRPKVITPTGLTMKRLNKYDQSFISLEYDARTSGGQKPEIIPGTSLPRQVLVERDIHREVIQDAGGDPKNVLRGNIPSAKASGVLFEGLRQTAELGHWPDIIRFYRSLARVNKKRLILAQKYYTEQRMIKIMGKGSNIQVKAFKGADLKNNTDVRLELDVGLAATKAGQAQIITNLATAGIFGDLNVDPDTRNELLEKLGITGFTDKINLHVARAEKENSEVANLTPEQLANKEVTVFISELQLDETGRPIINPETGEEVEKPLTDDPLFKYDNHAIHYETHRRFILSNEFLTLSTQLQTILLAHADTHQRINIRQRQAMMEEQVTMAQAAVKPKEGQPPRGQQGAEIKAPGPPR